MKTIMDLADAYVAASRYEEPAACYMKDARATLLAAVEAHSKEVDLLAKHLDRFAAELENEKRKVTELVNGYEADSATIKVQAENNAKLLRTVRAQAAENTKNMSTCQGIIKGLTAELEAAKAENENLRRANLDCVDHFNQIKTDYDALQAKLSALEKQEPVAEMEPTACGRGVMRFKETDRRYVVGDKLYLAAKEVQSALEKPSYSHALALQNISEALVRVLRWIDDYCDTSPETGFEAIELQANAALAVAQPAEVKKTDFEIRLDQALDRLLPQAQQPAEAKMVTPYISQEHFDRAFPDAPLKPTPDCRTCSNKSAGGYCIKSEHWMKGCTNGDQYQPAPKVVLWRTE
jgi:hypothetical protein